MSGSKTPSSRRAFLTRGGAILGAGVTATAGAAVMNPSVPADTRIDALQRQLAAAADREAIRTLHLSFMSHVEGQRYGAVAELFEQDARVELSGVSARGRSAIHEQLAEQYGRQLSASVHTAYRQGGEQRHDRLEISDDRLRATATFHVETEVSTPLRGDSTLAEMARLQGNVADRHWQKGRFEAEFAKVADRWQVASLRYLPA